MHYHSTGYILFPMRSLSPSWLLPLKPVLGRGAGGGGGGGGGGKRTQPRKLQWCI